MVAVANASALALAVCDALTAATEDHVEVHTVNASGGVVLDTEIDVLADTEAEGASVREVVALQLKLLDLEALLEELLGLLSADSAVDSNLLVTADAERADSQARAREHWGLVAQLLKHLRSTSEAITTFTNADVDAELLHDNLPHGVGGLVFSNHLQKSSRFL